MTSADVVRKAGGGITGGDILTAVRRPRPALSKVLAVSILVALLVAAIWSLISLHFTIDTFTQTADKVPPFLDRMLPLKFPPMAELFRSIGLTLGIVFCGTGISALLSVPVAYLAARNTSPAPWLVPVGRTIGVVARAIPDVIFAMLFVLLFSLGALPGIIAVALHSIGMISKLFADAIEQIDERPRQAVRTAGATRGQEFWSTIFPQVLPSWIASVLHRADINLRGSVILGYAGIVGLGYDMNLWLQALNYHRAMAYAVVIFVLCVVFEIISTTVRGLMLGSAPTGRSLGSRTARLIMAGRGAPPQPSEGSVATIVESSPQAGDRARAVDRALRRPWTRDRVISTGGILVTVAVFTLAVSWSHANWNDLFQFWRNVPLVADRSWPPTFSPRTWSDVLQALLTTVQIALVATLVSAVVSMVLGTLAARNAAPNRLVRGLARGALLFIRAIPELILAIVFIIVSGLGPQAGAIAVSIGGIGLLGKLVADSIEEVPSGPPLAVRSVGGTRTQVFFSATAQLSIPSFIGNTLYLLDTNIRSATLLGIVGAGGIGFYLTDASRVSRYDQVVAFTLVLIAVVLVIEGIAVLTRKALR